MYNPEQYMTFDVVADVVAQFVWPAPYELEDELPDGVVMALPSCHLLFDEGFESEVSIKFLPEDTGLTSSVTMKEALLALQSAGFESPGFAGARSTAQRSGGLIESPGFAGARSTAQRCGGLIDTGAPAPLTLIADRSPRGSLAKVKNGLHDQCAIVLAHFRPSLQGDFGWVAAYRAYYASKRAT